MRERERQTNRQTDREKEIHRNRNELPTDTLSWSTLSITIRTNKKDKVSVIFVPGYTSLTQFLICPATESPSSDYDSAGYEISLLMLR